MIVVCLDRLLAEHKMQSAELAEEIGYTVQTVSRVKTGKVKSLRMDMLDALCETFDCQPGDLLEYMPDEEAVARYGERFVAERSSRHL